MTASASADLELLRASLLLESNPAAAARRASDILASSPGHPEANLLLAAACRKLGDPAAAATVLESLANAHLDSPLMQLELGRALAAAGQSARALGAFRRAVELDAGLAEGWRELSAQHFAAGDAGAGDAAYATFRRLAPDPPELSDAIVALGENRLDAAHAMLTRRLRDAPQDVVALRMLADVAMRGEDYAQAEQRLQECLNLAPGYAAARFDMARALHAQHRSAEALPHLERLLASDADNTDYLNLKAQALRLLGRTDEALALMEAVVARHPQDERSWLLYGHLLREVGEQAQAIATYRRALAARPGSGRAYWSLANLKTFRFESTDREAMQRQLAQAAVRGSDRTHLEFALGKALEDAGQYEAAFAHYARGNALHRATIAHDADATSADVERSKRLYSASFFAERAGFGSERSDPIFVVGLPRSGSTLVEQLLASHSQVEGAGELTQIPAIALQLMSRPNPAGRWAYPEPVRLIDRDESRALAARYLETTQPLRTLGKARFVDKMLGNFGHLGLIELLFPKASIIDVRRHPLACTFSCYKQLFARAIAFSYDFHELARHYCDYVALMEHFDTVLPGRVYRIYYERLVADPASELKSLLEYCRLPFESQCLRFFENPRVVRTISSEQVRQPLYQDSIDQWQRFEPWLAPLKDALGEVIERYPAAPAAPA